MTDESSSFILFFYFYKEERKYWQFCAEKKTVVYSVGILKFRKGYELCCENSIALCM